MSEAKSIAVSLGGSWRKDGLCIFGCGSPGINGVGGCRSCVDTWREKRTREANEQYQREHAAWVAFKREWLKGNDEYRAELERRFDKAHHGYCGDIMKRWIQVQLGQQQKSKNGRGRFD